MPFTIGDVDKYKKGLSDKAKEQWIAIANSVSERCERAGGDMCDADAIKQANGAIKKNMSVEDAIKEYALKDRQTFNINGVEIFSSGTWNGDNYNNADIDNMCAAFGDVGFKPPLKLGHEEGSKDGQPAIGWVDKIYRVGNKLLADFKELPMKVYDAIKRGNYKQVSSEIFWDYHSNDKIFSRVLKGVALLGADIPAVTSLDGLENLYHDKNNIFKKYEFDKNYAEWDTAYINDLPDAAFAIIISGGEKDENGKTVPRILRMLPHHNKEVKNGNDNDSVDKIHLRNALARLPQTEMSVAEKGEALTHLHKHAEALQIGVSKEMEDLFNEIKKEVMGMDELEQARTRITELENKVIELSGEKEISEKTLSEIKEKERIANVKNFIDAQKAEGKILPAFEKEVESLLLSSSEEKVCKYSKNDKEEVMLTQGEALRELIIKLPKLIEFKEITGEADVITAGSYKSAGEEVDRLAKAYAVKQKVSYGEAIKIVLEKNPTLKKDYIEGGK